LANAIDAGRAGFGLEAAWTSAGSRRDKSSQAGRGRCATCGTALDDPSPQALVKRAERVLAVGEQIMTKAIEDEDFRLGLQAIDRAKGSLDQLLKVHGILAPDGGVNVTIDARKQNAVVLASAPEPTLRFLADHGVTPEELNALAEVLEQRRSVIALGRPKISGDSLSGVPETVLVLVSNRPADERFGKESISSRRRIPRRRRR
jgi:hypothetical protein